MYNLLNLPQQVDILSPLAEARNAYSYSADGVKLRVVKKYNSSFNTSPIIGSAVNVSSMDVTKTTDYVGNKIFENNVLDRIFVDGGYIKNGVYYFYETDHLGDNNQSGTVVERNDYYPYGMQMAHNELTNSTSGSDNKRKFGNKELDVMSGLNLYDSQARSYDPTLGRFTTVDPMAEKYYSISPYVYCKDNPLRFLDPDGRVPGDKVKKKEEKTATISLPWYAVAGEFVGSFALRLGGGVLSVLFLSGDTPQDKQTGAEESSVTNNEKNVSQTNNVSQSENKVDDASVKRRKNRLPDKGEPNTTKTNKSGTTKKKYGDDGNVQNPNNPAGRGDRQPGRPVKKNELEKDFQ